MPSVFLVCLPPGQLLIAAEVEMSHCFFFSFIFLFQAHLLFLEVFNILLLLFDRWDTVSAVCRRLCLILGILRLLFKGRDIREVRAQSLYKWKNILHPSLLNTESWFINFSQTFEAIIVILADLASSI